MTKFEGKPCRKCNTTLRYLVGTGCVECAARRSKSPERKAYNKARSTTPEYAAYYRAREATPERRTYLKTRYAIPEIKAKKRVLDSIRYATVQGRTTQMFIGARGRARKYGHEFNLELTPLIVRVAQGKCEITGIEFDFGVSQYKTKTNPWGPSIDRIDNARGYTWDNIQIVCNAFNLAKNEFPECVIYTLARALAKQKG